MLLFFFFGLDLGLDLLHRHSRKLTMLFIDFDRGQIDILRPVFQKEEGDKTDGSKDDGRDIKRGPPSIVAISYPARSQDNVFPT